MNFVPESEKPQDVVVAALKNLGGVAHLSEIIAQCVALGHPQPGPSIRRLCQQFGNDASWAATRSPARAIDLF